MATQQISQRLAQRARSGIVGREAELQALLALLGPEAPVAVQLHGISGIGKTALIRHFARAAREAGATVIALEGRDIEPTEAGFLAELRNAIGGNFETVAAAAERLDGLGDPVVLTVDTYEVLRLLDTWLRRDFLPALPANTRVVLSGRAPPVSGWLTDPGWQGAFRSIRLAPLGEAPAIALLESLGIVRADGERLNRVMRGHPLALTLAAGSFRESPDLERTATQVIDELTHTYLASLPDRGLRSAVEAVSIVRRVTASMLAALVPEQAPEDLYARLRDLPFVEAGRDGLVVHDAVREVVASHLRATNPARYRALRHAAWRLLNEELEVVAASDLWRYSADMLYLTENPVIREAFFPSDHQPFVVEPAAPGDRAAVPEIAESRDGTASAGHLGRWWEVLPGSFKVVRDGAGAVTGFYCCFDAAAAPRRTVESDPVTAPMFRHLKENPLPSGQGALILRKWLSAEAGEAPSPVQAACWLDVKRTYVEMRTRLRRVYTAAWDVAQYANVLPVLGFDSLAEAAEVGDRRHLIAVNDFGPGLVLGWMSGIVGAELGLKPARLLDTEAHEIVVDGRRTGLTALEFRVMAYLCDRERQVASRDALLEDVWGVTYDGASNVVDVVIRSLRRKLGPMASAIETVRGVGYRFHRP